ncbi:MAG: hypothetical protein AB7F66_04400 [Bacteriovoracia bacterium]
MKRDWGSTIIFKIIINSVLMSLLLIVALVNGAFSGNARDLVAHENEFLPTDRRLGEPTTAELEALGLHYPPLPEVLGEYRMGDSGERAWLLRRGDEVTLIDEQRIADETGFLTVSLPSGFSPDCEVKVGIAQARRGIFDDRLCRFFRQPERDLPALVAYRLENATLWLSAGEKLPSDGALAIDGEPSVMLRRAEDATYLREVLEEAEPIAPLTLRRLEALLRQVIQESYPELVPLRISLKPMRSKEDFFKSDVEAITLVRSKENRHYRVFFNEKLFQDSPSEAAIRAILAHELSHIQDYYQKYAGRMIRFALWYLTSDASQYEHATDRTAIDLGYARGLKAYRAWLYKQLTPKIEAKKRRVYYTPEEIDELIGTRQRSLDTINALNQY